MVQPKAIVKHRLKLLACTLISCHDPGAGRNSICAICQEAFMHTDHIFIHKACRNAFHASCIHLWIVKPGGENDQLTCPMCRGEIPFPDNAAWQLLLRLTEFMHEMVDRQEQEIRCQLNNVYHAFADTLLSWHPSMTDYHDGDVGPPYGIIFAAHDLFKKNIRDLLAGNTFTHRVQLLHHLVDFGFEIASNVMIRDLDLAYTMQNVVRMVDRFDEIFTSSLPADDLRLRFQAGLEEIWNATHASTDLSMMAMANDFAMRLRMRTPFILQEVDAALGMYLCDAALSYGRELMDTYHAGDVEYQRLVDLMHRFGEGGGSSDDEGPENGTTY